MYAVVSDTGRMLVVTSTGTFREFARPTLDNTGNFYFQDPQPTYLQMVRIIPATSVLAVTLSSVGRPVTFLGVPFDSAAYAAQRLVNLSTRASTGSGDQVAIVGFVITGLESKPVLVRAVGPTLRNFGVTTALTTTRLELMRGSTRVAANTGWSTAANVTEIAGAAARSGAFPLAPDSADSVI